MLPRRHRCIMSFCCVRSAAILLCSIAKRKRDKKYFKPHTFRKKYINCNNNVKCKQWETLWKIRDECTSFVAPPLSSFRFHTRERIAHRILCAHRKFHPKNKEENFFVCCGKYFLWNFEANFVKTLKFFKYTWNFLKIFSDLKNIF